jgi:hypothetical protein
MKPPKPVSMNRSSDPNEVFVRLGWAFSHGPDIHPASLVGNHAAEKGGKWVDARFLLRQPGSSINRLQPESRL